MAVSMYFGLPGCGKTTMLAKLAYDASHAKKPKYKHIYGNLNFCGISNYIKIEPQDLGRYMLEDCLILIDEGSCFFDNRDYKNFSKALVEFFMLHRHYKADVVIATQGYNGVDKKIRTVTDRLYYMHKSFLTGWYKTIVWRIPYDIIIPSKKDTGSAHLGEIVEGYCKPPLLVRLFTPNLKRPKYYPYFDSWERKQLPALPSDRAEHQAHSNKTNFDKICEKLSMLPKWRFLKRAKYTKLKKDFEKCLTSTST